MLTLHRYCADLPRVWLAGLEDNRVDAVEGDTVEVSCLTESNPPADTVWRHAGTGQVVSRSGQLRVEGVTREQAGSYLCTASNTVGTSPGAALELTVRYGAGVVGVEPSPGRMEGVLGAGLELHCEGEGNPAPLYSWLQQTPGGPVVRSTSSSLNIPQLAYQDQGEYFCQVSKPCDQCQCHRIFGSI